MTRRALITGAAGQDGTYLTELLLGEGYEVWGVVGPQPGDYLRWAAEQGERLHPCQADLADGESLDRLVAEVLPDEVYNYAAISSVALSWEEPTTTFDVNATGVARLVEALKRHAPNARLCQASSAEVFGHPAESPQTERTVIRPVTPYGSAKAAAHYFVQNVRDGWGMFACNAILYNHESPRRPPSFVTRKVSKGVAHIKLGLADELLLGNLDVVRDWGFAGDYVDGMWRTLQAEQADDYIFATGMMRTVGELCDVAFRHAGMDWRDYVRVDERYLRPLDQKSSVGSAEKAKRVLGWEPKVTFQEMVAMMVDADIDALDDEQRQGRG